MTPTSPPPSHWPATGNDYLTDRNANIPIHLPAVWATLGQHIRAEALARSITDPDLQAEAAEALARAGQHEQAAALARSITDPGRHARALAAVAEALGRAGQHEQAATVAARAETVARSITDRTCKRGRCRWWPRH
jgi:hypothetical protein